MKAYSEALVGDLGAGLNVGQTKKLSIGVQLVAKPDFIFFVMSQLQGLIRNRPGRLSSCVRNWHMLVNPFVHHPPTLLNPFWEFR